MTTATPVIPAIPLRLPDDGEAGYMGSRMARHPLRRRCDIVMFDNQSTAYRDAIPGGNPLPPEAKKSAGGQALQLQPARFDLKTIIEGIREREEITASQPSYA